MVLTSFYELRFLWDGAGSFPIRTIDEKQRAKRYILKMLEKREVVRCFRDAPGYLMIASRRKRLDDYFEKSGASREKAVV
jgi:hypothetical protein